MREFTVKRYGGDHYAVYDADPVGGAEGLRAITHSREAAEQIAEILKTDHKEHAEHKARIC